MKRWVRGSQGIFAGSAPPPFHQMGGSLRGFFRLLVLIKAYENMQFQFASAPKERTLFIL